MEAHSAGPHGHIRNILRMMERCGVDLARFAQRRLGTTMVAATEACLDCPCPETCRKWLDSREEGEIQAPPDFCPNAERFRRAAAR